MKVIAPTAITDAALVSSSVPETDFAQWAAATTYAAGDHVISTSTHRIYESIVAANQGFDPTTRPDDSHWIDVGPTNRWAMFDQAVGSATIGTGEIDITLAPGAANALAVLDTTGELVRVVMTVGGTSIYDETQSTNVSGGVIADWYAYFTAAVGKLAVLTFLDLPLYSNGQVAVTITGADPNGPVDVGTLLVGRVVDLGSTEAGASISIIDYSTKTTDDFGVTTVVERAWSKQMTAKSLIDTTAVDGIQRQLAALRAIPSLWIGEDGYDSLAVYGFFKDFQIDLTLQNISYCSLTIEGLI